MNCDSPKARITLLYVIKSYLFLIQYVYYVRSLKKAVSNSADAPGFERLPLNTLNINIYCKYQQMYKKIYSKNK